MSPENLSRRAILAGAAAVPALALPAVIATAIPAVTTAAPASLTAAPDPVITLAERAMQLYDAFSASCTAINASEKAMIEWRNKNPQPAGKKIRLVPLDSVSAEGLTEEEQKFLARCRTPRFEYEAATEQDKAAIRRWRRRERAAEHRTGYAKADADQTAACHASARANDALQDAIPKTFAGLAAKARVARYVDTDAGEEIGAFLMRDVGVLAGEVDREAVQS
jgi:hypothetical protein